MKGNYFILAILLTWIFQPSFAEPIKHPTHHKHIKHHHKHHHLAHKKPVMANLHSAPNEYVQPSETPGFVSSIRQSLVQFIQNSVATLSYSAYKLGGSHFDTSRGIYIVDCSGYVDNTLRAVYPQAYLSLVNSTGSPKPNSLHYYDFFKELSQEQNEYWSRIEDIEQLQPGDILVFRYKKERRRTSGHVMIVMNKPVRDGDAYFVSVADSAPEGHSQDTRLPHMSGIGIGTLLLRVDPETGQPSAYAWKIGSRWKGNVNFAMGRPLNTQIEHSYFNWQR